MIRVVLDTNVLASAALSTSSMPAQVLAAVLAGTCQLVLSEAILIELERTLDKPYFAKRLTSEQVMR